MVVKLGVSAPLVEANAAKNSGIRVGGHNLIQGDVAGRGADTFERNISFEQTRGLLSR